MKMYGVFYTSVGSPNTFKCLCVTKKRADEIKNALNKELSKSMLEYNYYYVKKIEVVK